MILQKDNPILRKISKAVPTSEINSPKIKNVIEEMKKELNSQDDGLAIAGPQIGELWRIFVVSGKVPKFLEAQKNGEIDKIDFKKIKKEYPDTIFINPEIKKMSRKTDQMEEGCLSARWLYGRVRRSQKVTIEALDENGQKIKAGATGLLAQIFQHEIDHLNGILFIDKAEELEKFKPGVDM